MLLHIAVPSNRRYCERCALKILLSCVARELISHGAQVINIHSGCGPNVHVSMQL